MCGFLGYFYGWGTKLNERNIPPLLLYLLVLLFPLVWFFFFLDHRLNGRERGRKRDENKCPMRLD